MNLNFRVSIDKFLVRQHKVGHGRTYQIHFATFNCLHVTCWLWSITGNCKILEFQEEFRRIYRSIETVSVSPSNMAAAFYLRTDIFEFLRRSTWLNLSLNISKTNPLLSIKRASMDATLNRKFFIKKIRLSSDEDIVIIQWFMVYLYKYRGLESSSCIALGFVEGNK